MPYETNAAADVDPPQACAIAGPLGAPQSASDTRLKSGHTATAARMLLK
jgi:hypothetical protein